MNLSSCISTDADMQTALFRNALMVSVFPKVLTEGIKSERVFDESTAKMLLRRPHTEQIDHLIFLYAAGVLDIDAFTNLAVHNDSDFLSDVIAAENYLEESEGKSEEDILPYKTMANLLLLCANSKKITDITPIDFNSAARLISSTRITLTENGFIHCERELAEFLLSVGEPLRLYAAEISETEMQKEAQEEFYLSAVRSEDYETDTEHKPLAVNYSRLCAFVSVFDEIFGKEFIRYTVANNMPVEEDFKAAYKDYLREIKLKFDFKVYKRCRWICGKNVVNSFDYSTVSDASYDKSIELDPSEYADDNELFKMALRKYQNSRQLSEDMVLEAVHCGRTLLYVCKSGELQEILSEDFHRQLFDFDKIWAIIQKCSREKKITKKGEKIFIPEEYLNEIPREQRQYLLNMVEEQYKINLAKQRKNSVLRSMDEIRQRAAEMKTKKQPETAEQPEHQNPIGQIIDDNGGDEE